VIPWKRNPAATRAYVARAAPPRAVHVLRSWPWGRHAGPRRVVGVGYTHEGSGEVVWVPDSPEPEEGLELRLQAEVHHAVRRLGIGLPVSGCPAWVLGPRLPRRGLLEVVECAVLLHGEVRADVVEVRCRADDASPGRAVARHLGEGEYEVFHVDDGRMEGGGPPALRRGLRWPTTAVLRESRPWEGERFVLVAAPAARP
jgi:hypothetical protein